MNKPNIITSRVYIYIIICDVFSFLNEEMGESKSRTEAAAEDRRLNLSFPLDFGADAEAAAPTPLGSEVHSEILIQALKAPPSPRTFGAQVSTAC